MSRGYQQQKYEPSTDSMSWVIDFDIDFQIESIGITLDAKPTAVGSLTLTIDRLSGSDYDTTIRTINMVGVESLSLSEFEGFAKGDKLTITYSNPDGVSITGVCTADVDYI